MNFLCLPSPTDIFWKSFGIQDLTALYPKSCSVQAKTTTEREMPPLANVLKCVLCMYIQFSLEIVIVFRNESLGYYAFVIVMLLPHRFLVSTLHPAVLIQSFSNSGHILYQGQNANWHVKTRSVIPFVAARGPKGVFLWALWRPCVCSTTFSFQPIFSKFSPNIILNHVPDSRMYLSPFSYTCGH